MAYIDQLLQDDEPVLYRTGLSPWANMGKVLAAGFLFFGSAYAYATDGLPAGAVGMMLVVAIGLGGWAHVLMRSVELAVTDRRVLAKTGVISRDAFEVNLSKIEGAQLQQSVAGRILGYGTVTVRGVGDPMPPLDSIDDPIGFRNALMAAADDWNRQSGDSPN